MYMYFRSFGTLPSLLLTLKKGGEGEKKYKIIARASYKVKIMSVT